MQKAILTGVALSLYFFVATAQDIDTLRGESDLVFSISKWEQKQSEIPNKISKVAKKDILFKNPQTSADMLAQTGAVFVQKSQMGGGSPMIRGFATNRVLLVVDGIRMNNAIYRSGNLQNVISIDALSTQKAEVIFGPGSLVYGSDAIGGVMDFHSLEARLNPNLNKNLVTSGSALVRYNTANQEKTAHADVRLSYGRFSLVSSVTYSDFDDLVMGLHGGQDSYLRPEYIVRENEKDVVVPNSTQRKQVFSGYDQWNFLQKVRFKPNDHIDLQYAFYYGGTGTAPRYDRLTQYRNAVLRFAEWNYGPMLWRMHTIQAGFSKKNALYDRLKLVAAYQNYEESRIDRTYNRTARNTQAEHVKAYTFNLDANKSNSLGEWYYGLEAVFNKVGSTGITENISNGQTQPITSRYPDGSTWNTLGAYLMYQFALGKKTTLNAGLRYNYGWLDADFNNQFYPFPYQSAHINDGAHTGSLGLVYRPAGTWQLNLNAGTGFRLPNVDDVGKLFESAPGNLTVPNPDLQSEYAWNFEIGVVKQKVNAYKFELNLFYSLLINAIVRRPYEFNGSDSIVYDGVLSRVEALQNIGKATVYGAQLLGDYWITPSLDIYTMANYIHGEETDDVKNEQVPLRHAPPFYGRTGVKWKKGRILAESWAEYNSEVSASDLPPSEQSKTNIYATDAMGRPYSPGWYTINARASYIGKKWMFTLAWENISNQRYRPYSSGIVAPGSNFMASVRFGW